MFLPISFDAEAFRDPADLLALEPTDVESVRWGLLLDLVGYYLLLVPLAIVTRRLVAVRHGDWARLASWSAGAYILVGAVGAASLAAVYPALAAGYGTADTVERTAMETAFTACRHWASTGCGTHSRCCWPRCGSSGEGLAALASISISLVPRSGQWRWA